MIVKFFDRLGFSKQMRWEAMSKELEGMVLDELNYRLEADAAARMHKSLLNHAAYAPKVFFPFCTTTTIVLENLNGVKMSDYLQVYERDPARCARWCAENRVKPKLVAYRLFASLQRQIFEDNLFHADTRRCPFVSVTDTAAHRRPTRKKGKKQFRARESARTRLRRCNASARTWPGRC
jgi:predicted unusual protein kinase regulating ubiquinone biosynthesis (AarF/ABC1/UbiB family)